MQSDNWAQKAKNMGYRSRAVFKLEEILKKNFRSSLVGNKNKYFKVNKKFDDDMKLNDIATGFWLRCILPFKFSQ